MMEIRSFPARLYRGLAQRRPGIAVFLALFALSLATFSGSARSSEPLTLTFPSIGSSVQIPATLIKPDGPGPFPAVVIMHDCTGLGTRSSGTPMTWARYLVAQGYVVILPDSFTPRGFRDGVCTLPPKESRAVNGHVRAQDAYGALAALRQLPYVDGKHVGIMGGSHGGISTLAAMFTPLREDDPLFEPKHDGFSAAVALYPRCGLRYGAWNVERKNGNSGPVVGYSGVYKPIAPVLILIGEKDDWTPAQQCRELAETSRKAGFPVDIKVYPGAYHGFDTDRPVHYDPRRTNPDSPTGHGATTGGNFAAWSDAKKEVVAFFAKHLKQ
jgi:dienelactone hydrolase